MCIVMPIIELSYLRSSGAFTLVSLDICKCIFWNVWCRSRISCTREMSTARKRKEGGAKSCWALTLVVGSVVSWLCDLIGYNHYPHCPKPWPQTRRWTTLGWKEKVISDVSVRAFLLSFLLDLPQFKKQVTYPVCVSTDQTKAVQL